MILIVQIEVEPKDGWEVRGDLLVDADGPDRHGDVSSQRYTPSDVVNSLRDTILDVTKHSDVDHWRATSVSLASYRMQRP